MVLFILSSIEGIRGLYQSTGRPTPTTTLTLVAVVFALSIVAFAASISVPRRPDVFLNGRVVDQQWTGPFLSRMAYSWAGSLLRTARNRKELDIEDLPAMDHYTRAKNLHDHFNFGNWGGSLLRQLLLSHRSAISRQHFLTLLQSILQIAPQIAMFQLLKVLELRDRGEGGSALVASSLWVVGLGLTIVVQEWIENWMW